MRTPGFAELAASVSRAWRGPTSVAVVERVDSTNRLARKVAGEYLDEEMPPPPAAVIAWDQTTGRGRGGRSWSSAPGSGVWATVIRTIGRREVMQAAPLAIAVALSRGIERHLSRPVGLKWPNDLVIEGRKIGGILMEGLSRGDRSTVLLVGFGINWLPADPGAAGKATSMVEEASSPEAVPELGQLAWELIDAVHGALETEAELSDLVERYRERMVHQEGEEMRWRLQDREVIGTFRGISPEGFLLLEVEGREERIGAGEVVQ